MHKCFIGYMILDFEILYLFPVSEVLKYVIFTHSNAIIFVTFVQDNTFCSFLLVGVSFFENVCLI